MSTPGESGQATNSSSSSQLSERLRKTIQAQRSPSPGHAKQPSNEARPGSPSSQSRKKLTLEERLKASFTIGEASVSTTPNDSQRPSPGPVPDNPLSPASTPLPDSPEISRMSAETVEPSHVERLDLSDSHPLSPSDSHPLSPSNPTSPQSIAPQPNPELEATEHTSEQPSPSHISQEDAESVSSETASAEVPPVIGASLDVEALQERLKVMEHRFAEVSQSFKRLQAERLAADTILRELTPVEALSDSAALRDYLDATKRKYELAQNEMKSLSAKIQAQEGRLEELRDTHRLESSSQTTEIDRLRKQLEESESLLRTATSNADADASQKAEIERLGNELAKFQEKAKGEEEKRVKAVTLLKTVRQKLVKAEKDKDEVTQEVNSLKERDGQDKQRLLVEKAALEKELEASQLERERAVAGLKGQFDKEVALLKDRHEKEMVALRGQSELDVVAIKSLHGKELANKDARIASLEEMVSSLTQEKNRHFEDLQHQQATFESSQTHVETLQAENADLRFRLRDANERVVTLSEELTDLQQKDLQNDLSSIRPTGSTPDDVARLLSETETRYEVKIAELKKDVAIAEKERSDSEAQWSKRLREKVQENDDLRRRLGTTDKSREQEEETVSALRAQIERLTKEAEQHQQQVVDLTKQIDKMVELQNSLRASDNEHGVKISSLERLVEEGRHRESLLRTEKKNLKEELRKVQSSAALLEKQRHAGVGYWAARGENGHSGSRQSFSSVSDDVSPTSSPAPSSSKSDEEVNLEYLRNVILQFLEHKEMRPNLVKVLSIILHFTPQETRRVIAKV